MKRLAWLAALACALTLALSAAGIDGKWVGEVKVKAGKKKGGGEQPQKVTFDLKSSGGKLSGTVTGDKGRRGRSMEVVDGRIEGDSVSFTTVQKGRKAEQKWVWRGTLRGEDLTGTRSREGARRGASFAAKRS
jgi:hypothetical protein